MAVHSIRIQTTSVWCVIELRSPGIWARAPGHILTSETMSDAPGRTAVVIDDRSIRIDQSASGSELTLVVQVATQEDSISLYTNKGRDGVIRITAEASGRINTGENDTNPLQLTLFLNSGSAGRAGVGGGDASLAMHRGLA